MKRDLGVDLARIIAAFMVIMLHILGQGGILDSATAGGIHYWTAWFLEISGYCCVNIFALISGYIMVDKPVKPRRLINIWLHIFFYSILITVLFFVFIPETRSVKNLVYSFLPIISKRWWYASSYFALFLCVPFLNAGLTCTTKSTLEKFLTLILIGVGIMGCVIQQDAFLINNGYSTIWLMILYLFGAYIKKYNIKEKFTAAKSMIGFWTVIVLTFLSKFAIYYATELIFGEAKHHDKFTSQTAITLIFAAVFMLLFCLNLNIGNRFRKLIDLIASTTFGVYLIHVYPLVFDFLFLNAFASFVRKPALLMVLCILATTVAIFTVCSIIELLRIRFFKLLGVSRLCEIAEHKLQNLSLKLWKA